MSDIIHLPDGATDLSPEEREGLRFPHITTRAELNEVEQANIESGLLWLGRQRKPDLLTIDYMCRLHDKLFGEVWAWAGAFRKTEKNIGIDPLHIGPQLYALLGDVSYWVENGTFPPSEAAIRFHHRLVSIHLFPNGNGRHARIAADALLEKVYGVEPINWAGGFDLQQMNDRRVAYIAALRQADKGNFDPLFAFVGPRQDGQ